MDLLTHALSGVLIASAMPQCSLLEKSMIVAGTIIPDIPFGKTFLTIAKLARKSVFKINMEDFAKFGPKVVSKLHTYWSFHSFFFLAILAVSEFLLTNAFFLTIGWACHLLYDLPSHNYKEEEFKPKPLYPLSISFDIGMTNGWKIKPQTYAIVWGIHILLIILITNY